jgi:double-stranded uracil-DNA glycosylase
MLNSRVSKPIRAPAWKERSLSADATLPDLLREGLSVIFVGINPSVYSAEKGHYFARPGNRFWPAFSRSRLGQPMCRALGVEILRPDHDRILPDYGFGFTDVVKKATRVAADLSSTDFTDAINPLLDKISALRPDVVCFHGITGYQHVHDRVSRTNGKAPLGWQQHHIGKSRVFLAPNPSGANAHFTLAQQAAWYDELAAGLYPN